MTDYFLGVDGGGTSTDFALIDSSGDVLARGAAPSSYYFSAGIELVVDVLNQIADEVNRQADIKPADITYAFCGLPSYGEVSGDVPFLDAAPEKALGHRRYRCGNDMVCGWAGSLAAADGINVISGTGSMGYGRRAERAERVGGWGELFGDEGSAYWIARRGLNLFSRMSDGRAMPGPLLDVIRQRLALDTDLDLIDVVLNRWHGSRDQVAALSPEIDRAAAQGDEQAGEILRSAGRQLAQTVDVVRRKLDWPETEPIAVSYSGGVFGSETVRSAFRDALGDESVDLRRPLFQPAVGAALYAARLNNSALSGDALARLGDRLRTTEE